MKLKNNKRFQSNNHITVKVPVELLFSGLDIFSTKEYKQFPNITRRWVEHHFSFSDISIARFMPHIELFQYLMGYEKVTPSKYLNWYCNLFTTRDIEPPFSTSEILMKKYQEYIFMKNELENSTCFFRNYPPIVRYNKKGYFNLEDGHHRAIFLFCSGKRYIFVKMSMTDYRTWINEEGRRIVSKVIHAQARNLFYTPILHPAFYNIRTERDIMYPTRLELILK